MSITLISDISKPSLFVPVLEIPRDAKQKRQYEAELFKVCYRTKDNVFMPNTLIKVKLIMTCIQLYHAYIPFHHWYTIVLCIVFILNHLTYYLQALHYHPLLIMVINVLFILCHITWYLQIEHKLTCIKHNPLYYKLYYVNRHLQVNSWA